MKNILILSALFLASCTKNQYTTNITEQSDCKCEYVADTAARNMNYKEVQLEGLWALKEVATYQSDGSASIDNDISKDAVLRLHADAITDGYYTGESGVEYITELSEHNNLVSVRWKYDFQLKRIIVSDVCGDNVIQIHDIKLRNDSITLYIDRDVKRTLIFTRIP